jgi:hypothetical protein
MQPRGFCQAVMHEYERQWSLGGSHAVRHPLRLKMELLARWCVEPCDAETFERRLTQAQASEDAGEALLGDELAPLWRQVQAGRGLPFGQA